MTSGNQRQGVTSDVQVCVRDGVSSARLVWLQWLFTLPALLWGCYVVGQQLFATQMENNLLLPSGWRLRLLCAQPVEGGHSLWACWWYGALYLLPIWALITATAISWTRLFARLRGRDTQPDFWLYALWLTLLCAPTLPLHWVFVASVLMLLARECSTLDRRYRVQPVAAGYLLLLIVMRLLAPADTGGLLSAASVHGYAAIEDHYSLWQAWLGLLPAASPSAASLVLLIGGICLLLMGITQRPRIIAALLGFVVAISVCACLATAKWLPQTPIQSLPWFWQLSLGNTVFAVFFLAADPACAASTRTGAWCSGLMMGVSAALLQLYSPFIEDSWLIAIVSGSSLGPWLDSIVVRVAIHRCQLSKR